MSIISDRTGLERIGASSILEDEKILIPILFIAKDPPINFQGEDSLIRRPIHTDELLEKIRRLLHHSFPAVNQEYAGHYALKRHQPFVTKPKYMKSRRVIRWNGS